MVSVIIPVYNEEAVLRKNDSYYQMLSQNTDLIFADGGSTDGTVSLAGKWGRVIAAPRNRAVQMNRGAAQARHDVLLFLHADAFIHGENIKQVAAAVEDKGYIGGCFRQVLDDPSALYRWIAWTGNLRAKLSKVFYGDQAIFVRKDIFQQLEGFPEVAIGEDVLFTKGLRRKGRVDILPCKVYSSARRWKKQGVLKTFLLNMRINWALTTGEDLGPLARVYADIRDRH